MLLVKSKRLQAVEFLFFLHRIRAVLIGVQGLTIYAERCKPIRRT